MAVRMRCTECRATFLVADNRLGEMVACPKCEALIEVPETALLESESAAETEATWVLSGATTEDMVDASSAESSTRRRRRLLMALALLLLVVPGITALVMTRPWEWIDERIAAKPFDPNDPASVAQRFVDLLDRGDFEAATEWTTLEADQLPAARDPRMLRPEPPGPPHNAIQISGDFSPLTDLHRQIDREYEYDPAIGRFQPRNPLGLAADTLQGLEAAKEQVEQGGLYDKIASGDPDDLFDAAESLARMYTDLGGSLTNEALSSKRLVPTYKQLVDGADPKLTGAPEMLADHYVENSETWDDLLNRPFFELDSETPFALEEVRYRVTTNLGNASPTDPPTILRLTLTRFNLGGRDTGWKVTRIETVDRSEEAPPSGSTSESIGFGSDSGANGSSDR